MFPDGNNLNRGHIYFQDFWKCFSILIKAQQLQLNRKTETYKKRERGKLPGPYLCWPSPPGSAQPTGPASRRPPPARRTRSAWPAPAATRRPPPASADALQMSRDATRPPRSPLILSHSPPRLPHSSPRWPSAYPAADRRSCHQSHPLAPPTSPIALPRRPAPPR